MTPLPARLDDLIDHVIQQNTGGDPLDHVSDAVIASERLGELADHLVGHFVDQARRAGASWAEIGRSMGVTKQAVQKRFVPRPDQASRPDGNFARFTDRARRVTVHAADEARLAGNDAVTADHVLLGLLDEPDALAARALSANGVSLDAVRDATRTRLERPAPHVPEHIPFAASAKRLLELTLREALLQGHNYVGTEHILLAMLHDDGNPAAAVLTEAGLDAAGAEAWLDDQLGVRRRR